jgi:hypothetical protein
MSEFEEKLKTNHNIRVVNLTTGDNVLCVFGEIRNPDNEERVLGYKMLYPFKLILGEPADDGTVPVRYIRWCPFSPTEEHRLSGEHIISVVFPDNSILNNFVDRLNSIGIPNDKIFYPEEETDGDNSEPAEAGE